ncbi:ImmA/IrrE family metallo-endopeptidase [Bradyrhizobium diazoefficiens]|uniref:ImmA/IrrE family metallo-endopeptidase n=1 Tax=Bradyrhizobium diazoefficiens TaxID=1355477 RepID=UPI002714F316|nr:ImmA/IrrE family metallo-endopeptidase [Bradyrhizobium diazoefficiens]WLB38001.1 ImmA/IrrE family metallo-endopeptidase [Bradyrhizobium diazoefficiens]WLC17114.1 ImmA/IrrE family metallo-endopeptidase [Bradyrhizobium diazoefficiens]
MSLGRRIDEAARCFWDLAGGRGRYGSPVDLERAVAVGLPLGVVKLPRLSSAKVAEVLARIGTSGWTTAIDRPLRACLVADVGVGLVFLDGTDSEEERRFSLAHEVAHFLLHYLEPRRRVVDRLGTGLIEVLDRAREPTMAERLSSAMSGLSLEPFRHAMARDETGRAKHLRTESIEGEADDLAFELVAPADERADLKDLSGESLASAFGLPTWTGGFLLPSRAESDGVISLFRKKPS